MLVLNGIYKKRTNGINRTIQAHNILYKYVKKTALKETIAQWNLTKVPSIWGKNELLWTVFHMFLPIG